MDTIKTKKIDQSINAINQGKEKKGDVLIA
jgi:hypothetical protein